MATKHRFLVLLVAIVSHLAVLPIAVFSQTPFYQGKTLKLVTDDVSPLMSEELLKVIKETPRDPEVIEMLKKFTGVESLPPR